MVMNWLSGIGRGARRQARYWASAGGDVFTLQTRSTLIHLLTVSFSAPNNPRGEAVSSSHSLHAEASANLTGVKGSFCRPPVVRDCTRPAPSPQAASTSCSSATIPIDGLQVSVRCGVLD